MNTIRLLTITLLTSAVVFGQNNLATMVDSTLIASQCTSGCESNPSSKGLNTQWFQLAVNRVTFFRMVFGLGL